MSVAIEQVLSQIVAFLIMLWVLKRFAWKPIQNILDERREKIISEFKLIEKQKSDLNQLTEEYQRKIHQVEADTRKKVQEEIAKGQKMAQRLMEEAQEQSRAYVEKTRAEMDREILKAKVQLKTELVDLIIASSEKIIKKNLDEAKQKMLVNECLEHLEIKS